MSAQRAGQDALDAYDRQPMANGKRVLVVDDNQDNVRWLVEFLRDAGHDARGCHSGEEALDRVLEYDPDAVLMDINLPGASGWETASEIRRKVPGKRPVLIAVTGERKGPTDLVYSKMVGFDHYVLKPADPQRLLALIDEAGKGAK